MEISKDLTDAALSALKPNYQKVLRVNLTTGKFEAGVVPDDEGYLRENQSGLIDDYWGWFIKSGLLHKEDIAPFKNFIATADAGKHIIYRRQLEYKWHKVIMELFPTVEYAPDHRDCLLYVRDIDCIFAGAYEAVVEQIGTTDSMTGLYNRLAFERDSKAFKGDCVGVVYADINGLKWTNDHHGHEAGDELIRKFANLLKLRFKNAKCYHLSGDEFAVLSIGCSVREFLNKAIKLHKAMWNTAEYPLASMGYSVGEGTELKQVLKDAEESMYDDKEMFRTKYPDFARS